MATYDKQTPFADWTVPSPGVQVLGNTYRLAQIDAVTGFRATSNNNIPLSGATDLLKRYCALSESHQYGEPEVLGRHLNIWDNTAAGFLSTGRRLLGGANVDCPDVCQLNDAIFYTDGVGRWGMSTAPFAYVFSDDGGVFTDESTDAADNGAGDVQIMPSAAQATGDALYVGASATFAGIFFILDRVLTIGSGGTATYAIEYWNGAWTAVTVSNNDPGDPLTGTPFGRVGQYAITWTIPGDWATTSVNSQTLYWVRIRATGASGSGYVSPTATKVMCIESSAATKARVPAAWHLTNDPTSNAAVKGWGLWRLETGNTAQVTAAAGGTPTYEGVVNVYYTWYDSTRDIESDPVLIGSLTLSPANGIQVTTGHHPDPNVDKVRVYLEGISGAVAAAPSGASSATLGTGKLRLVGTIATGTTSSQITIGLSATSRPLPYAEINLLRVGDGPYVASSVANFYTKPATTHGTYLSCCTHLGRVFCGGSYVNGYERRLIWSHPNNGWCFLSTNYVDVPMGEGDHIIAVRSVGTALLIIGRRTVWMATGDPGQGSFTIQQIAQVGAVSKLGCVVAGQRCFFVGETSIYAVEASGSLQDVGGRIRELVRNCTSGAMGNICGAYDSTRQIVAWAMPGLQAQTVSGASPGQTLNDGLLILNLEDGTYRVWLGTGCYAQSLGLYPSDDAQWFLAVGGYFGRVHTFQYDLTHDANNPAMDTQDGAIVYGTVTTGSASTTLRPGTAAHCLNTSSDWRQVGEFLLKWKASVGWEARMIINGDGTDWTVHAAWTNTPASGDLYWVGAYYVAIESGDWFLEPMTWNRITALHPIFELVGGTLAGGNVVDFSSSSTDVLDTTGNPSWSPISSSSVQAKQSRVPLEAGAGLVQRWRIASLIGGSGVVRWALRGVSVIRELVRMPHARR